MTDANSTIPLTITKSMEDVQANVILQVFTSIQLIYGIPSSILILYFFMLMSFGKKYSNSFYRLVQWDLLVNLICYTNSWFAVRLTYHPQAIPILKSVTYLIPSFMTWTGYFAYFFMHLQFVSAIALSIHRLSSVLIFTTYERLWKRYFLVFCVLCLCYSYLCNTAIPGFFREIYISNGILTLTVYVKLTSRAVDAAAYFSAIYFVLLFGVGMTTSKMVTRKIKEFSLTSESVGKKLTKIAFTYGTIYSGILFWSVVSALNSNFKFFPDFLSRINSNLLPFASDLMTLALPYILMIYDTNIQKDVLRRKSAIWSSSQLASSSFMISR